MTTQRSRTDALDLSHVLDDVCQVKLPSGRSVRLKALDGITYHWLVNAPRGEQPGEVLDFLREAAARLLPDAERDEIHALPVAALTAILERAQEPAEAVQRTMGNGEAPATETTHSSPAPSLASA